MAGGSDRADPPMMFYSQSPSGGGVGGSGGGSQSGQIVLMLSLRNTNHWFAAAIHVSTRIAVNLYQLPE